MIMYHFESIFCLLNIKTTTTNFCKHAFRLQSTMNLYNELISFYLFYLFIHPFGEKKKSLKVGIPMHVWL